MIKKVLPLLALIAIALGSWWAYTHCVKVTPLPDGLVQAVSSQCEQTRRDAKRHDELYAEGTATRGEAEQARLADTVAQEKRTAAEAQLNQAEAVYDEACLVRDKLTLTAPSDGVVTNRLYAAMVVTAIATAVPAAL